MFLVACVGFSFVGLCFTMFCCFGLGFVCVCFMGFLFWVCFVLFGYSGRSFLRVFWLVADSFWVWCFSFEY